MSEDNEYTRRRLLQATVGAGVIGAGTGAVTGAYLSDRERFRENIIGAGRLNLELATTKAHDSDEISTFSEDDFEDITTIALDLSELERDDAGVVRTGYRLYESLGQVWIRTHADGNLDLANSLNVRFLHRPVCSEEGDELFSGVLADLAVQYEDGEQLGDDCLTEPACLDIEWVLDPEDPVDVSEKSVSFLIEFAAVQCRHNENPANPWN